MGRKSPLLLSSNRKKLERQKMLRLSLKKLKKIQDCECLLHKTVLISNTILSLRRGANLGDIVDDYDISNNVDDYDISNNVEEDDIQNYSDKWAISNYSDNYDISTYSPEEELILNSIKLPALITPISDAQDTTEDNMDTTESNPGESNTTAVITSTEHREHNQDILADKHKHSNTVVEHFYKNLHSLRYIIAG